MFSQNAGNAISETQIFRLEPPQKNFAGSTTYHN